MTSKIRLASKCNIDSIVDGPGLRIVVWTQGCPHHCPFCHNPQTHSYTGGFEEDVQTIIDLFDHIQLQSGVTFSGGEPFEQVSPLLEIAKEAKKRKLNIWTYTGYLYEDLLLKEDAKELLNYIDVLVDGKFVNELKHHDLRFKGSLNQRIIDVKKSIQENKVILSKYDEENQKIKLT
ncbi:MAG: anaerobic ribonucleoside-triphosphate reductase activating protein [Traorella sp.]